MKTNKMTIKAKLIFLAASLVLLLFIVGLFSVNVQRSISENENVKSQFKSILIKTLELRKSEKDFLLREPTNMEFFETGKSKYVSQFDTTISEIFRTIDELKKTELVMDNQFNLDELINFYNNYSTKFHDLVAMKHKRGELNFGLIGEMRKAVHAVEKAKHGGDLITSILLLRKKEKDYLIRRDTKYVDEFNTSVDKLLGSRRNSKYAGSNLSIYKKSFNEVVAVDVKIGFTEKDGIMGELRAAIHKVEPAVDKIIEEVDAIIKVEDSNAVRLIYVLLFIGLAIAATISFFIIRSIIVSMKYAVSTLDKIANGNLNLTIEVKNEDEIGTLLQSMQAMVVKLKGIVSNIQMASNNITEASNEMNSSAQQMSEDTTEQASSVEEISSSMEEMTANIQQNTTNSLQTEKMAQTAAKEITEGNASVLNTVESMKTIASKISIVGEIARQTNLLALNAAVEAARAGEHGKGFAVVAAEVRKLAERSQAAATEINDLSFTSVEVAQKSGELLKSVVPNIKKTAELVQEITAASREQNSGSEQVNNAIQQLNQVVQSNAATAEELAATAEELNAQAENLKDMIAFFDIGEIAAAQQTKKTSFVNNTSMKRTEMANNNRTVSFKNNKSFNLKLNETAEFVDKDYERF